ncbi:MAG: glycoside hydrolase family 2 TIM barrel-domain containing protein [Mangrovibacterium sp.]
MNCFLKYLAAVVFAAGTVWSVNAQKTELVYLSGTGLDDTKTWDFYCSGGMNSGKWGKIEVPSQWELQGYGQYTFGRFYLDKTAKPSDETGLYRYRFNVPADWKNKQISIVFEGVMTDTEVKVNGKLAGEIHQGGFYRFEYAISDNLKFGEENELQVKVWKESANRLVNAAERRADWWLFGGIYRPVYLKASPKTHISRIAVDAQADGTLHAEVHLEKLPKGASLVATISPVGSKAEFPARTIELNQNSVQTISTQWSGVKTWDCENPNLYMLKLDLLNAKKEVVHTFEQRIGFRTIEFRPKDGIYLNGTKLLVKGTNRHCFDPAGGRTTNKALSIKDALLIKEMNMNAVRSHYPPDTHFLDVCDSLGILYLDELAGWQNGYDEKTGRKLLAEMIAKDVNHPCIFIWSNGNEGGWTKNIDEDFATLDPQNRHVVHPWADYNQLDTHHYPAYQTGMHRLASGYEVFMPTEFNHGLYDRGQGAGLDDFWAKYTANPLFAGGFLWAYVDEAVKRTDKGGILDSDAPNGPDGIVGPNREKEGSFYTVREVWSPIQVKNFFITPSFKGDFFVRNAYLFTNLNECRMVYRVFATPSPLKGGDKSLLAEGKVTLPSAEPGETVKVHFDLPEAFFQGDVLEIEAFDKTGASVCNWTFPIKYAADYFATQRQVAKMTVGANVSSVDGQIVLSANGVSASFEEANGMLKEVRRGEQLIPLNDGPLPVGMKMKFKNGYTEIEGNDVVYVAKYTGAVDSIVWRMTADGLLGMDAVMLNRENGGGFDGEFFDKQVYNLGLTFSFPEKEVTGMRWMGRGPYRVWKNRIKGTNYGIWEKAYNNTITGDEYEQLVYPEFKGYHANLYWASLESDKVPFTVYSETDGLFFRVFTPQEPANLRDGAKTMWEFPEGDLSFLFDIPAMRSGKPIAELGPNSQPSTIRIKKGDEGLRMTLWFDFR